MPLSRSLATYMKPPSPPVALFLFLLSTSLISIAVISSPETSLSPEASPTSKELVVYEQFPLSILYESSGFGTPVTEGAGSSELTSQVDFSDWPPEVPDSSLATVPGICSVVNEPGRFLLVSLNGNILSMDCKSGIKQWELQTGSAISYSDHAISEADTSGCFLYSGEDWNLYEYCKGNGFRKLDLTIEEYVHNTPEIKGAEVTIGSKMTAIYLLDADTGEELHKEQLPSNHPAFFVPKFEKKLVSSKLESSKKAGKYIIIVRTDYYLNSSVLGKPQWNMMDSRISAMYINNEIPARIGADLKVLPRKQKYIPVYFPRKVNKAIMAGFVVPILPLASDFRNTFSVHGQNIYQGSLSKLRILHETTEDLLPASIPEKNFLVLDDLYFYTSVDSSKDTNECTSGTCIMLKPSESKMFYEVTSLQSRLNRRANSPVENVLGSPEDSFRLTNSLEMDKNPRIERTLKAVLFKYFNGFLLFFMFFPFIFTIFLYILKTKLPTKHDKLLNNKGKPSPKKRKARKAVNMKNNAVTSKQDQIVPSEEQNVESNGHFNLKNFDSNIMALLRCNGSGEGRLVGKLFVSDTEIGLGSIGTVVFDGIYDGRAVAVKRLLRAHHNVAFKEIRNLIASDQHPNIVRLYGVEEDRDFVYISLERCISSLSDLIQLCTDFPSLQKINHNMTSNSIEEQMVILPHMNGINREIELWRSNGLPAPQLLKLMRDVVSGVAHLHKIGIIHRDLKPQNVLVSDGETLTAKVSDMGISKRLQEDTSVLSHHPTGYGSSGWQAPEQLHHGHQTSAVDLFSLGCILFFCITKGGHPFGNHYERDLNIMNNHVDLFLIDHIPEAVHLLSKMLNPEPKMRPTAVEVLHHPLFWSSELRLSFLRDTSDRIELEDRENESKLLTALENAGLLAFGGKWGDKLDAGFISDMGRYRKYKFDCMRDLLRLIRNKLNHYRALPRELKEILGPVPVGFDQYFSERFPRLLIEAYKVLYIYCKEEDSFSKYFKNSSM